MSLQKRLLSSFLNIGIFKYSGDIIAFGGSLFISRFLDPDEYGIIAIITVFYGFLAKFSDLGITASIVREEKDTSLLYSAQVMFIILGLILGMVMAFAAYPISLFFDNENLLYLGFLYALILFLYTLPNASEAFLLKNHKFIIVARVEFLVTIFTVALTMALASIKFSFWALVIPHVFTPFIFLYAYRKHIKIPFLIPNIGDIESSFNKFKSIIYNLSRFNIIHYWEKNTDSFWIGKFYNNTNLGIYNRAYFLSTAPISFLSLILMNILLPIFQEEKKEASIKKEYEKILKLLSSLTFIPLGIFILIPYQLCTFLWGDNWYQVGDYLPLLAILLPVQVINSTTGSMFILFRKERLLFYSGLISGITTIITVTIGAFFSIKTIIYLYIFGVLFISIPIIWHLGFYKSFRFSKKEIFNIWFISYLTALSFFILRIFNFNDFQIYPLLLFGFFSLVRIFQYIKSIKVESI